MFVGGKRLRSNTSRVAALISVHHYDVLFTSFWRVNNAGLDPICDIRVRGAKISVLGVYRQRARITRTPCAGGGGEGV